MISKDILVLIFLRSKVWENHLAFALGPFVCESNKGQKAMEEAEGLF